MTEPDDIVARLRSVLHDDRSVELMAREAADEIERLREELTASHESHGNEVGALTERLSLAIHERDEVRQSYCSLMEAYRGGDGRVTANKLGWGYLFEEDDE